MATGIWPGTDPATRVSRAAEQCPGILTRRGAMLLQTRDCVALLRLVLNLRRRGAKLTLRRVRFYSWVAPAHSLSPPSPRPARPGRGAPSSRSSRTDSPCCRPAESSVLCYAACRSIAEQWERTQRGCVPSSVGFSGFTPCSMLTDFMADKFREVSVEVGRMSGT